jgi:hypothetical protein
MIKTMEITMVMKISESGIEIEEDTEDEERMLR